MAQLTDEEIRNWFTPTPLDTESAEDLAEIREAAIAFAQMIRNKTPPGSLGQMTAIRIKLVEVLLWVEDSIRTGGT